MKPGRQHRDLRHGAWGLGLAQASCRKPQAAFTTIELVATMVVLSILALAVAAPTLGYLDKVRTRGAAGRIVSDLRYAQRHAMSSRLRTWVVFNALTESYAMYVENASNLGKANRVTLTHPLDQNSGTVQLGAAPFTKVGIASVAINGNSEVEFDSFGKPYDSASAALTANGTITLTGSVTVTLYPVSGYAEQAG